MLLSSSWWLFYPYSYLHSYSYHLRLQIVKFVGCTRDKVHDIVEHYSNQISSPLPLHICFWLFSHFQAVKRFCCERRFLLWGHVKNSSRRLLSAGLLYRILILSAVQRLHLPVMLNREEFCLVSLTLSYGLFHSFLTSRCVR